MTVVAGTCKPFNYDKLEVAMLKLVADPLRSLSDDVTNRWQDYAPGPSRALKPHMRLL
jgi:hypothetical protein